MTLNLFFFDTRGKCYIERYVNGKIYEKGNYENSLDTLKEYISGRASNGKSTPIYVKQYFEPLKNEEWVKFEKKKIIKSNYKMGILISSN
jgi:hypothetical protein